MGGRKSGWRNGRERERERERERGEGGREVNSTNMWEYYIHNIFDFSLSRTYFVPA